MALGDWFKIRMGETQRITDAIATAAMATSDDHDARMTALVVALWTGAKMTNIPTEELIEAIRFMEQRTATFTVRTPRSGSEPS